MFVKLTSGFTGAVLLFRKLVLRDFWRTGSKSCKPEVTFAIYPFVNVNRNRFVVLLIKYQLPVEEYFFWIL